jgi:molybdate-binding protein
METPSQPMTKNERAIDELELAAFDLRYVTSRINLHAPLTDDAYNLLCLVDDVEEALNEIINKLKREAE